MLGPGVIRVPCRGRGTIRVGGGEVVDVWQEQLHCRRLAGAVEVVDVWQEQLKL
uniref:Uncharacterized protein n=1 Tax=Meloidogyne enterolobii TaxID=390850 RepID=A0A6V7UJ00_MELEN|nr:unnamed protein product [Meloidogyne enterolobii]